MDHITLSAPVPADLEQLLAFELDNRAWFEASINARPPAYYAREGVGIAIAAAIDDAAHDRGYQFLVRSSDGELIGRVNLGAVKRAHFHSAVLGYRIGRAAGGKGYASEAVRQVLAIAFGRLGLWRIEADASTGNAGSIRVLERNGFLQYGRSRRSFELRGTWHDRLHFERHAGPDPQWACPPPR